MLINYGTRHRLFWQDFIVVTAYNRLPTNSLPVGLRGSTTADNAFQHWKAQLLITKSVFKLKMVGDNF